MVEQIVSIDALLEKELVDVWRESVKATHDFLTKEDIEAIKPDVKIGIYKVELFCIRDAGGKIKGFMGISENKIQMLFVHPHFRGQGVGWELVKYALYNGRACFVDVNEQNEQASGFYKKMGFTVFDRSALDDQGRPFPVLRMKL